MSKEKLSAETISLQMLIQGRELTIQQRGDAQQGLNRLFETIEQLQREREEAKNVILNYVEAFTSGNSIARMNAIQNAIDFLTPKPEK